MDKMLRTARKLARLEKEISETRAELRRDVTAAHESGESVSEIARRLDVTRARIYQLLGRR